MNGQYYFIPNMVWDIEEDVAYVNNLLVSKESRKITDSQMWDYRMDYRIDYRTDLRMWDYRTDLWVRDYRIHLSMDSKMWGYWLDLQMWKYL